MWHLAEFDLTPQQQLALDEVLLLRADEASGEEHFRLWELSEPAVVIGRGSRISLEVNREACRQARIPILRRCSGGASIVAGPGCLFYSITFSLGARPELRSIDAVHRFVLDRMSAALAAVGCDAQFAGISDLAISDNRQLKKISGNSLRLRRNSLLYHGTLLYDFDLASVERLLAMPPRQPDYRARRSHTDFMVNLPVKRQLLVAAIMDAWSPLKPSGEWPQHETNRLAQRKYATRDWTERL